jgi:hypothetical protein
MVNIFLTTKKQNTKTRLGKESIGEKNNVFIKLDK